MSTATHIQRPILAHWPPAVRSAIGLGVLLLLELLAATNWLDGASLGGRSGLLGQIGTSGAWILRFGVGFAAAFAAFAGLEGRLNLRELLHQAGPLRWSWLAAHAVCVVTFVLLGSQIYGTPGATDLIGAVWLVAAAGAVPSLALAFAPLSVWAGVLRDSGSAPWLAALVSVVGVLAVRLSQSMWESAAQLTFYLVQVILRPVLPVLTVDPEKYLIRGRNFGVIISQECSGLEGIGLMLVFSLAWLWLYRREFRFPRAYLLVPIGVVTLYALNAFRIAALLLIGDAGAKSIAAGGFHSQAGWIAFNAVALGMTLIVPRLSWFVLHPRTRQPASAGPSENPTAAYLLPFLVILATGMLTRAGSASFDWFYGARFVTAAVALWFFRDQLRTLDWRCSWPGVLAGVATFGIWLGLDVWLGIPSASMPNALAEAEPGTRGVWIVLRALAAITTVPVAEELAFRAFALRRLASPDFETMDFRQPGWWPILASSVAFGMLHGERWIAGILAGLLFAWAARRANRFGDAVAAHAIANATLAAWVLLTGAWQYW